MSVGNQSIDDQHRYLICLINTSEMAIKTGDYKDTLRLIIEQLVEYTRYHFETEERIQEKIQYPDFEKHKREHQELIASLAKTSNKISAILDSDQSPPPDHQEPEPAQEVTDDELNQLLNDEPEPPSLEAQLQPLLELLRHWIIDHVIGADLKMRPYLKSLPYTFN